MKEVVITIYAAIYFQQYIFEVIVGDRFVLVKKTFNCASYVQCVNVFIYVYQTKVWLHICISITMNPRVLPRKKKGSKNYSIFLEVQSSLFSNTKLQVLE